MLSFLKYQSLLIQCNTSFHLYSNLLIKQIAGYHFRYRNINCDIEIRNYESDTTCISNIIKYVISLCMFILYYKIKYICTTF